MLGKTLVLALDNHDLHVSVHPDFPEQNATITLELGAEGQHGPGFSAKLPKRARSYRTSSYLSTC